MWDLCDDMNIIPPCLRKVLRPTTLKYLKLQEIIRIIMTSFNNRYLHKYYHDQINLISPYWDYQDHQEMSHFAAYIFFTPEFQVYDPLHCLPFSGSSAALFFTSNHLSGYCFRAKVGLAKQLFWSGYCGRSHPLSI